MQVPGVSKGINTKGSFNYLYLLVFILIAFLVGLIGYSFFLYNKRIMSGEKRKELSTIADLKADQITQWRKDCIVDASAIYANAMIAHRFIDYFNGKETSLALEEFRTWLTSLHDIAGYSRAVITRPNGEIVVSVPDDHHLMTNHCLNMTTEAARRQEVIFSDFHRDDPSGHIHLNLIIPIKHTVGKHSKTIAVLSLEMDPHTFLYPLIRSWPTQSKTAETLLVERDGNDVLFLNNLRFRENTALSLRYCWWRVLYFPLIPRSPQRRQ